MITVTRLRLIAYLAAIFLVGGITGASIARMFFHHHRWGPPVRPHEMVSQVRSHLRERLDLTPAQVEKIDPLIEKLGDEMWAIHRDTMQRVGKLMDSTQDKIAAQLTPDQRRKLEQLKLERESRMHDRPMPFHGGPPGPDGKRHRPPPGKMPRGQDGPPPGPPPGDDAPPHDGPPPAPPSTPPGA